MDDSYTRYNLSINADFSIQSIEAFKKNANGTYAKTVVTAPAGVNQADFDICGASFLLLYYCEVVHATLHVYHYCMTAGIDDCTRHSSDLKDFAEAYITGVPTKYKEVKDLLFTQNTGALTGSKTQGGFIADFSLVMTVATALFDKFASFTNAEDWINGFFLGGIGGQRVTSAGVEILEQFFDEAEDIAPFANDLVREFTKSNTKDVNQTNTELVRFFNNIKDGTTSPFRWQLQESPLKGWIECMSVTGLMHAGTLSFSRELVTQPIMCFLRPESDVFTDLDLTALQLITGTIVGIRDGRHVYTDEDASSIDSAGVSRVLKQYDSIAVKRRSDYWDEISRLPSFDKIGWILTDYCNDDIDNKQITISTYI
jgi:hypothetical protein